ncbi:hypothetical protein Tco_1163472 [Tanacetum coccineum]
MVVSHISEDDDEEDIKWVDLIELVKDKGVEAMDLDSPKDDQPLLISSDNEADIQAEVQAKTKDTIVPPPPSPKSIKIQELTNQLIELLVNALKPELTQLLTNHDFIASILTELKELPSKVNEIDGIVGDLKKYLEKLEIDVPGDLKALPDKLEEFHTSIVALTNKVTSLEDNRLEILVGLPSRKAGDHSVPLKGQVGTHLAEGEKNTRKPTITQLFQRRHEKDVENGEKVRDKGKKALSHEEVVEDESDSDSDTDSKKDLIDIVGLDVVEKVYKDKMPSTKEELELDVSKPLEEQDLIIKPNLLAKKKRKNADDLHDYFKSTKRQDFISIEDFEELNNDMLYHVQEIFFKLHQGLRTDDLARTFSSFLVAEVDKRNLNPLKQMRLIEQRRQ